MESIQHIEQAEQAAQVTQVAQVAVEATREIATVRQTIASYINLIKPHVTVLLLGVTAATMAIARQTLPPLALLIPTLLGGAMAAGSANCINCYIDRDIDRIMSRTQRRSLPAGRVQPRQALLVWDHPGRERICHPHYFRQSAERCAGLFRHPLLRLRLHPRPQAYLDPKHRDRRCRRCRAGTRRLGRRHQQPQPDSHLALRPHLLLDPPTLLGALPAHPKGL